MTGPENGAAAATGHRLVCVAFVDVVGYTAMAAADELATVRIVRRFFAELVRPGVQAAGGVIAQVQGDGALLWFGTASACVGWCLGLQAALAQDRIAPRPLWPNVSVRIGAHLCQAIVEGHEVYGDGVNAAKRLQEVAPVDGVVISEALHAMLPPGEAPAARPLGQLTLKGVPQPLGALEIAGGTVPAAGAMLMPDPRPSIAVLPFEDTSADGSARYFAEGVVDDIVTSLSAIRELFVIARGSTLPLGREGLDPAAAGRTLGVSYVMSGRASRSANRVRLSWSLIDVRSREALCNERAEMPADQLFDAQDRITERIVARIAPQVREHERRAALRKPPASFTAYDHGLRGLERMRSLDRTAFTAARDDLLRAIDTDPGFAMPYAWLARWHSLRVGQGWSADPATDAAAAASYAGQALALDRQNVMAMAISGHIRGFLMQDYDTALKLLDAARAAGPSHPFAHLYASWVLAAVDKPDAAIEAAHYALRLSPYDTELFEFYDFTSFAHYAARQYDAAAVWGRMSRAENPRNAASARVLAASLVAAGDATAARAVAAEHTALVPDFSLAAYARSGRPFRDPERRAAWLHHLSLAGFPP